MPPDSFYITTPIYYVNDRPHIGHAYTTILADVLARYQRLAGRPVHFLTGTDEHGQKVQQAAQAGGRTPQAHADLTVTRFQELWQRLNITHDDFIRTTEPRHTRVVQAILQDLYDRGEIYAADYDGWYDVTSETFVTEKDLEGGPPPEERPNIVRIQERNYFFRMSAYQAWLVGYIQDHPECIQPDYRRNETLGFLRKPLTDLCISRPKSRLGWGIELPFDPDFVTYVWFDALVNYISAIGYGQDPAAFARWWPASCHLIGKDILTTHTVYWPTMLKAMGLPLPRCVFAHGWWLTGRDKMSKSAGNVVNPMAMIDRYGVDPFRYFLMSEMNLGQDASFSEGAFVRRYNADLANDLGNLLSRVTKLLQTHAGGAIPAPGAPGAEEDRLREIALDTARRVPEQVTAMQLDEALRACADLVRAANRYLERVQPWTLAKAGDLTPFRTAMYTAAEALRIASGLLHPVMPEKMSALLGALGQGSEAPTLAALATWGGLQPGTPLAPITALFPRIERPAEPESPSGAVQDAPPVALSAPKAAPTAGPTPPTEVSPPPGVALVEYADFQKIRLAAARIVSAEKVPKADKLLRLQVEMGGETRQIVAGIAQHYAPESLPGRMIVVVANLKPATIRGLESQGMLLAASAEGVLRLVTVDGEIATGAAVK